MKTRSQRLQKLVEQLRDRYGKPKGQWSVWCKRPKTLADRERIIIEAILTQHTNWRNVERAVEKLAAERCDRIAPLYRRFGHTPSKLYPLIRSCGFYRAKTRLIFSLVRYIQNKGGVTKLRRADTVAVRTELLALRGVGPETADSILLYALDKPVFVIDEYTRRLLRKRKIDRSGDYRRLQQLFHDCLPKSIASYQDIHALIVIDGKNR